VPADQWKTDLFMNLPAVDQRPRVLTVASRAVVPQCAVVYIGVAVPAFIGNLFESVHLFPSFAGVAGATAQSAVAPVEWKPGSIVVEIHGLTERGPGLLLVAAIALRAQFTHGRVSLSRAKQKNGEYAEADQVCPAHVKSSVITSSQLRLHTGLYRRPVRGRLQHRRKDKDAASDRVHTLRRTKGT